MYLKRPSLPKSPNRMPAIKYIKFLLALIQILEDFFQVAILTAATFCIGMGAGLYHLACFVA